MKKAKKYILATSLLLFFLIVYQLFTKPSTASASNGEPSLIYSLIISWGPSIVLIILYIIFLRLMNKLLEKVERIAVVLEKNAGKDL